MDATMERRALAGWAVMMGVFWATTCVESLSWNQLSAFTPFYLRELGVPAADVPGWTAAMASLGWIVALPLAPFWGVWADRYSRKAVIVRSALVEAALFAGWAFASGPWMALAFRCLNGFVLGNTGVMLAVQASVTPRQRLGLAVGVLGAGSPAGRALGPILGAALIRVVDVRGMLLFDAAASLAMAALLVVLVKEPARERPVGAGVIRLLGGAFEEILAAPLLWRTFLALTAVQIGFWVVSPFLPIYITRLARGGPISDATTAVGAVLSGTALAGALASPFWGRVVDRFGHVRVLTLTSIVSAAALALAAPARTLAGLAAPLLLYALVAAALQTGTMALMARTVSVERRGAVLGQVLLPFYVAGLLGPALGGLAYRAGQPVVFGLAALATLVPVILLRGAGARS